MNLLILGLVIFLGIHSARVFAQAPRQALIDRWGPGAWKGVYSALSLVGLVLIVQGYGQARLDPVVLWLPPVGMRHAASLLTLLAFILLAAAYVPGNAIRARLSHPMTLSVKTWALAHLLANGNLADLLLFGSFLMWAVLNFRSARARDRVMLAENQSTDQPKMLATLITLVGGMAIWALITFVLHAKVVGVAPMG